MTDRAQAFIVVLDDDYRVGDTFIVDDKPIYIGADAIQQSIRMIKGVISVEPVITKIEDHIARMRVRHELRASIIEAIDKNFME